MNQKGLGTGLWEGEINNGIIRDQQGEESGKVIELGLPGTKKKKEQRIQTPGFP